MPKTTISRKRAPAFKVTNGYPETRDFFAFDHADSDEFFFHVKYEENLQVLRAKLVDKGWTYIGRGRHREVFRSPNDGPVVIKVSRSQRGAKANLEELFWSVYGPKRRDENDFWNVEIPSGSRRTWTPLPRVYGHTFCDGEISVLCVEWVTRFSVQDSHIEQHDWIRHVDRDSDGPQIGYTVQRRTVCFDWCTF